MPGNEITPNLQNLFERGNLAEVQHPTQIASGNCFFSNSTPWVQRQNVALLNSAARSYVFHPSADTGKGNEWQTLQVPPEVHYTRTPLKFEVNQHSLLNGCRDTTQDFLVRTNQSEMQHGDAVFGQHNPMTRNLSNCDLLQNPPGCTRNSEKIDACEAPVNFDFLGSQQPLTGNNFQSSQEAVLNDVQLWQQQMVTKNFQELQRQHHILQQNQDSRLQSFQNSQYAISMHSLNNPLLPMVNRVMIGQDTSNCAWTSDSTGGELKMSNTSQPSVNVNWPQQSGGLPAIQGFSNGFMFLQDQGQALLPGSSICQQQNELLYGVPVAGARGGSLIPFPRSQSAADAPIMLNKINASTIDKQVSVSSRYSSFEHDQPAIFSEHSDMQNLGLYPKQGFQEKQMFMQAHVSNTKTGITFDGKVKQINPLNKGNGDLLGNQYSAPWRSNAQQNGSVQMGASQPTVTLDPTEKKILFSSDANIWDGMDQSNSLYPSSSAIESQMDGRNYLAGFPPIQSGSWSALMQSAVAEASSNEIGPPDQWSGLTFHQTELSSTGNRSSMFDNNFQNSSNTRTFPLFEEPTANPLDYSQSSAKYAADERDKMKAEVPLKSLLPSPEVCGWLSQNAVEMPLDKKLDTQTSFGSCKTSRCHQTYEQPCSGPYTEEISVQNVQGPWFSQEHALLCTAGASEPNEWRVQEPIALSGESKSDDSRTIMSIGRSYDGRACRADDSHARVSFPSSSSTEQIKLWTANLQGPDMGTHAKGSSIASSSGMTKTHQDFTQIMPRNPQPDCRKQQMAGSSSHFQKNESHYQLVKGSESYEMSTNADRVFRGKWDNIMQKSTQAFSLASENSSAGKSNSQNTRSSASNSHSEVGNQKSKGQLSFRSSIPRKFQYHPLGNIEVEPVESMRLSSSSQRLLQSAKGGHQSQGHSYPQPKSSDYQNINIQIEKKNSKCLDDLPPTAIQSTCGSKFLFDGPTNFVSANKNDLHMRQNMLELFRKIDQPNEKKCVLQIGSSQNNMLGMADIDIADEPDPQLWGNQIVASQGFGLCLGPPQSPSMVNVQNSGSADSRNIILDTGEQFQAISTVNSLFSPSLSEAPLIEPSEKDNRMVNVTEQDVPPSSHILRNASLSSFFPSEKLPQEHSGSGNITSEKPANLAQNRSECGSENVACHVQEVPILGDGGIVQTGQLSSRSEVGNIEVSNTACVIAEHQLDRRLDKQLEFSDGYFNSCFARGLNVQASTSGLQPGCTSATMFQGLWTGVAPRQYSGSPRKVPPDPFQPNSPSPSNFVTKITTSSNGDDHTEDRDRQISSAIDGSSEKGQQPICEEKHNVESDLASGNLVVSAQSPDAHQLQEGCIQQGPFSVKNALVGSTPALSVNAESSQNRFVQSGSSLKNYSLLDQIQAMKDTERGSCRINTKGPQGDLIPDAQRKEPTAGKQSSHGLDVQTREAAANHTSASDAKILSFSSFVKKNGSDTPFSPISDHISMKCTTVTEIGSPKPPIDTRMGSTWFRIHESYKNGESLTTRDTLNNSRKFSKMAAQRSIAGKSPLVMEAATKNAEIVLVDPHNAAATSSHLDFPNPLHRVPGNHSLPVAVPKKRKTDSLDLLPWHKEVMHGSKRLQTISEAEMNWAKATNRLIEKIDHEDSRNAPCVPWPKRRLILTTQLMQQLFPALPTRVLSASAANECQTITYLTARLVMGDACSLLCSKDSNVHSCYGNMESKKCETAGSSSEDLPKIVEDLIDRQKNLESNFTRMEMRSSLLDLRVECQDLERFSIINRFARFHGRANVEGYEGYSAEATKVSPERYVTAAALSSSRSIPEGVSCLSL